MSKSLKRVKLALHTLDPTIEVIETGQAKTAKAAADALDVAEDQIAKSIIFQGTGSGSLYLFVTPGAQRVDMGRAAELTGEPLSKADAATIRAVTGFAIGGVSPVGHLSPIKTFFEVDLMSFEIVYAAAGTPHHVFGTHPNQMQQLCKGNIFEFSSQCKKDLH